METPDEKSVGSSDGYRNIEDRINNTLNGIRQIDRQIEDTPKDAKPSPVPRPPGWHSNRKHPGDRDSTIANLKGEQERLKAEAWEGIEKATRGMDEQTSRIVKDSAREKLFPNPYRRMKLEERALEHDQPKDIEQAQDYMDVQRLDKRAERDAASQPKKPAVEKNEPGVASPSERWANSLKYTKFIEQAVELVKEKLDRAPNKERD